MNVEIINVGTELLLGEIVNTNATYIQKMCKELGFDVYHQSVVGDNPNRLKECFQIAFDRGADCIITTGGLGPTVDDLTKELSAEFLGLELQYFPEEERKVDEKCKFVTGLDEISDNNYKQAFFPKDCYILENDVGTANGCVMSKDGKMIINLPGPPKEMMYVVEHSLKPYLMKYKKEVLYTKDIITMGIGESMLDHKIADIIDHQDDVSIALYASEQTVRIRLGYKSLDENLALNKMLAVEKEILGIVGDYVIDENMREGLKKILPKYQIIYLSDFQLRDDFILEYNSRLLEQLDIIIDIEKKRLGEIVKITLRYNHKDKYFEVPLLKQANLSYSKLEARLIYLIVS